MELKQMYNQQSVGALATALHAEYPPFDQATFMARVFAGEWDELALKARMRRITESLAGLLPETYRSALAMMRGALPRLPEQGFEKMVFPDFVEVYGLDDYEASIPALELFTQYMSAELAIRPFIIQYPQKTMTQMLAWASHDNEHVRRLASEGCRPRLPWAMALPTLKTDPTPILPILEQLKQDESETVRRSVANNLNDIAKDNPDVVIRILQGWQQIDTPEMRRLTSHALRTLLKQGHPQALALLGYPSDPAIAIQHVAVEPTSIQLGAAVTFSFEIESLSDKPQKLMIDFVVYHMKANGKQAPKVFKLSKKTLQPGERLAVSKAITFKPITTRKYYSGEHGIAPQINGRIFQRANFMLTVNDF